MLAAACEKLGQASSCASLSGPALVELVSIVEPAPADSPMTASAEDGQEASETSSDDELGLESSQALAYGSRGPGTDHDQKQDEACKKTRSKINRPSLG